MQAGCGRGLVLRPQAKVLKGAIDIDVDVDIDSYFDCFKGIKVILGTVGGIEAVMVLTLIFLK